MDRNIFEAVTKKLQKIVPPKAPNTPSRPAPLPKKMAPKNVGMQDPEIAKMLEEMRKMRLHLETQVTELYEVSRQKNFDIDLFLQTQSKLKPKELDKMLAQSQSLEDQFDKATNPESGFKKRRKSKEALEKERKAKTLGSRKKNWISIH